MEETEDGFENIVQKRHEEIWKTELGGRRRIISQGDLKYDINQDVLVVLPLYFDKTSNEISQMVVVSGVIIDIIHTNVENEQLREIPRETKLRSSPENASIYTGEKEWAKQLIIQSPREDTKNAIQTCVTQYKIELDEDFVLSKSQLDAVYIEFKNIENSPFKYNLSADGDTITVDYRYVMGPTYDCQKLLADMARKDAIKIRPKDVQEHLKKLKLRPGVYVRYRDSNEVRRNSGIVIFNVIDYICNDPLDIKFVIKCHNTPVRILAISKIYPFDVRCSYSVSGYHTFHALERYNYEIIDKTSIKYDPVTDVRTIICDVFDKLKIYTVKKSLCRENELDSFVYEEKDGEYIILHSENEMKVPLGYKFTGISMGKYIKGLAYPEGNRPDSHDQYVFFHSRDYYEIIFDKNSPDFFTFCPTSYIHSKFREPKPKDSILAIPFTCDRDNFKGKTNLHWFYPTNEFRILHLYITTNGEHQYFKDLSYEKIVSILKENPVLEEVFNLYVFGMTEDNPTLREEFTVYFINRYFWWNSKK